MWPKCHLFFFLSLLNCCHIKLFAIIDITVSLRSSLKYSLHSALFCTNAVPSLTGFAHCIDKRQRARKGTEYAEDWDQWWYTNRCISSFSLLTSDVSSLEGELVNKKMEDKTRQRRRQRQGKARKRDLQVKSACWGFYSRESEGIVHILNLRIGTTVPFKT